MDTEALRKWAEDLQKRERYLQEKERELESKFKKQTITDIPPPLGHSVSTSNLGATTSTSARESPHGIFHPSLFPRPFRPHFPSFIRFFIIIIYFLKNCVGEKKVITTSGRFKAQASRKPYRLQPLSEKNSGNGVADSTSMSTSMAPHTSHSQHPMGLTRGGEGGERHPPSKGLSLSKIAKSTGGKSIRSLALQEAVSDKQVADALAGKIGVCLLLLLSLAFMLHQTPPFLPRS
jgi:hypothetical protein